MTLYSALAGLSLATWMYLLLARGGFWKTWTLTRSGARERLAKVAVVMAARDEADVITEAIQSVLGQEFRGDLHVFLVDDSSSDGTAAMALGAAKAMGGEVDLTVLAGKPLAVGWTGKLWALAQGVEAAAELEPDYILFTDADIRHGSKTVAELVEVATDRHLDIASYMVKLHCRTLPEMLLIPPFVFFFLKLYPPAWIESAAYRTAGAAGGCVLIRAAMLRKIGGLTAIRNELIDDCALAKAVKRNGGKVWLGLTADSESIRPYTEFSQIGKMISRSAFRQLNHSAFMLAGAMAGLTLTYLAPVCLLFVGDKAAATLGMLSYLLMSVTYLPMVRFYKLPFWFCFTLPLAACFYLGATVHSAVQYWRGAGGIWKGRVQDQISSR